MTTFNDALTRIADDWEAEGNTCKTILVAGVPVKVCLDENGEIIKGVFREYAKYTHQ